MIRPNSMALGIIAIAFTSYTIAQPVSSTTVGHWSMDHPHASIVKDEINSFYRAENLAARFLTYGSPPTWSSDVPPSLNGHSLAFNGLSAGLTIPANKKMGTPDFSLTMWVKPEQQTNSYQAVYSSRGAAQGSVIYISPQGHWEFWLQSPKGWSKVVGPKVEFGQWSHIGATFDAIFAEEADIQIGDAKFYVNGQASAHIEEARYQPDTLSPIGIGYRGSANQFFYHGLVSQLEFYKAPLTEHEMRANHDSQVRPDSLIATWLMNEGEGSLISEPFSKSPNPEAKLNYNHPGVIKGGPSWVEDSVYGQGQSLNFDGQSDGVWIDANTELNLGSFTLSLLAKPNSSSAGYQTPISSRDSNGGYQIYLTPNKTWQFWLNNNGQWSQIGDAEAGLNQWQHIIATFESEEKQNNGIHRGTAKLYLDGILVDSQSNIEYQTNINAKMGIGYRGSDEQYYFNGKIDDVEIIAGVLDPTQVLNKTLKKKAEWLFSEQTGTIAFDTVSNHNGSFTDGIRRVVHERSEIQGDAVQGSNGATIQVPYSDDFAASHFSISAWVNPAINQSSTQTLWNFSSNGKQQLIELSDQQRWQFTLGNDQSITTIEAPSSTPSEWQMITATFKGERRSDNSSQLMGQMQLFINDQLTATANDVLYEPNRQHSLFISGGGNQSFTGLIDQITFYNHALSAEHVIELFNIPTQIRDHSRWDKGQAEYNPERWTTDARPGASPIHYPDLYQREREIYDYNPRYLANMMTFDASQRPVMVSGAYESIGDNSTIYPSYGYPEEQIIQVKHQNEWRSYSVNDAIRSAFNDPTWSGKVWSGAKLIHERVEFDNGGDAYLLACVDTPIGEAESWLLLYSKAGEHQFKSWQAYPLPSREKQCSYNNGHYDFQAYTPFINRDVPPALLYDQSNLVPLEKNANGLTIGEAVPLIRPESGIEEYIAGYTHSGGMNSSATLGHMTHFVFARLDSNIGNNTTDTDIYYSSYDHLTGETSLPIYMTTTGSCCLSPDNHNIPFILADSKGALHVIAGSHQAPFKYLTAATDDNGRLVGSWSDAVEVVSPNALGQPFNTYPGIVIDQHDTLHMVMRKVDEHDRYTLHYMQKRDGEDWQDKGSLVIPALGRYSVYYHKLSVSPNNELYLNYFFYHHFLSDEHAKQYRERWPLELIETGGNAEFNLHTGIKAHNATMLVSEDGGESWRLLGSSD